MGEGVTRSEGENIKSNKFFKISNVVVET